MTYLTFMTYMTLLLAEIECFCRLIAELNLIDLIRFVIVQYKCAILGLESIPTHIFDLGMTQRFEKTVPAGAH